MVAFIIQLQPMCIVCFYNNKLFSAKMQFSFGEGQIRRLLSSVYSEGCCHSYKTLNMTWFVALGLSYTILILNHLPSTCNILLLIIALRRPSLICFYKIPVMFQSLILIIHTSIILLLSVILKYLLLIIMQITYYMTN